MNINFFYLYVSFLHNNLLTMKTIYHYHLELLQNINYFAIQTAVPPATKALAGTVSGLLSVAAS